MEITEIVTLVANAILGVFVLFGFLYGVKRGLKKSTIRLAFVAGSIILAFFIAGPVTTALMNLDISSIVQLNVDGTNCATLNEYILAYLNSMPEIADLMNSSEAIKVLILQIPVIMIEAFLFVLIFWILKIITWPIYAVCAKNAYKAKIEGQKTPNKKRFIGGLVGAGQGLLLVFVLLLPIGGALGLVKALDEEEINNTQTANAYEAQMVESQGKSTTVLRFLINQMNINNAEQIFAIIDAYDKSIFAQIENSTGIQQATYDALSTAKVNNKSIVLRKELKAVNTGYQAYVKLNELDIDDLNTTLDIDALEKIVNALFNSDILGSVADDMLPYFVNKFLAEQEGRIDATIYNFLKNYVEVYGTPKFDTLKSDFIALVHTVKALQNNNLLNVASNGDFKLGDLLTLLQKSATKDPIADIINAIFESETLKNVISESVNVGLTYLDKVLSNFAEKDIVIEKVGTLNINWTTEKQHFINFLNTLVDVGADVSPYIDSENTDTKQIINSISFAKFGKMMDSLTSTTLFKQPYRNICDALEEVTKVSKYFNFATIKAINSWESEFGHLDNIKTILNNSSVLNIIVNNEINNYNAIRILQLLDATPKLSNQKYITSLTDEIVASKILQASAPRLINNVLNKTLADKLEIIIPDINESNINWTTESTKLGKVLEGITANHEMLSKYLVENANIKQVLMKMSFDELENIIINMQDSQLFGNIFDALINFVKNNESVNKIINLSFISDNYDWQAELDKFGQVIQLIQNSNLFTYITASELNAILSQSFEYVDSNKDWAKEIIYALYSTDTIQHNLQNYLNKIEDKVGEMLGTEIPHTTIILDELNTDFDNRKVAFANSLIDLSWIIKNALNDNINAMDIDFISNHLIDLGQSLTSLQSSYETQNIYNALINYLKNNENINEIIDFSVITNNFDWINEMNTLNDIVVILKENNIWNSFKQNPNDIENIISSLDKNLQEQILVKLAQSKFFQSSLVNLVNTMLSLTGEYIGVNLTPIDNNVNLDEQINNIVDIATDLVSIAQGTNDISQINTIILGSLLDNLKINKFEYNGVFSQLYDEFIKWLTNPNNNDYANNIESAVRTFDHTTPSIAQVYEIETVEWDKIMSLLAINVLIENVAEFTGQNIDIIPYTTDITDQKESINEVVASALKVMQNGTLQLDTVNRDDIATFLSALHNNKFSTAYTGKLADTYNAIVIWLCADNEYGNIIHNAIMCYAHNSTQSPEEVIDANWHQIMYLLPYDIIKDKISELTNLSIIAINYNQVISSEQRASLDAIYNSIETLFPSANISLDNIDKLALGNLLDLMKVHKFEINGIMSSTYDAIIIWLSNNADYGYLIAGAVATYDDTALALPQNVSAVNWTSIFDALNYLDNIKNDFNDFGNIERAEIRALMYGISQKAILNNDIVELITIYLTHDINDTDKIASAKNYDWKDYTTFNNILTAFENMEIAQEYMDSNDTLYALTLFKSSINTFKQTENTKLQNTTLFLDFYANTDLNKYVKDVDFSKEESAIDNLVNILEVSTPSLKNIKSAISNLSNSTLILNQLVENNVVVYDLYDSANLNNIRNDIASQSGVPASSVSDADIRSYINSIISNATPNLQVASKIKSLFNM